MNKLNNSNSKHISLPNCRVEISLRSWWGKLDGIFIKGCTCIVCRTWSVCSDGGGSYIVLEFDVDEYLD